MGPLIRPWRHLFDFSGRATRTEYLLFHVTGFAAVIAVGVVINVIGDLLGMDRLSQDAQVGIGIIPILVVYLVFLVTHVAIAVRRLHDHNGPGIKYLLTFIPVIGIFFWLMLIFTAGDDFENDYGYDPRQGEPVDSDELGGVFS